MLYTIMPYDIIFKTDNKEFEYKEISFEGNMLQLYKKDEKYIIKRVISTDPKIFLDNKLQPGNEFKL